MKCDINDKTDLTHEIITLPMTDHMTNEKEHQAVRRHFQILGEKAGVKYKGIAGQAFRSQVVHGCIIGVATNE